MRKTINLLFLCIATLCIMFGISITANAETSGYYTYSVYNGEATITRCSYSTGANVIIPSTLDGYPVVAIGEEAFYFCTKIKTLTIPDSITFIDDNAFLSCSNISTINIDSLDSWLEISFSTSKSNPLFYGADLCINGEILTQLITPLSTKKIGNYAFYNYDKLTKVVTTNNVTSVGAHAFEECDLLVDVELSDNTSWVGLSAFGGCSNLEKMTLPRAAYGTNEASRFGYMFGYTIVSGYSGPSSSEEKIYQGYIYKKYANSGSADFYYYHIPSSLKSITITKSVEDSAFYGCSSLETITIGEEVIQIGKMAFYECSGVNELNYNAIDCTNFEDAFYIGSRGELIVNIGENVKTIPDNFLYYSVGVTDISIPQSVDKIGANAFANTDYYNSIYNWDDNCLYADGWLIGSKNISGECCIKEGIKGIADGVFDSCTELTAIYFPNSLIHIGENAFNDCTGLTSIHINSLTDWLGIEFGSATSNPSYYCPNVYIDNQLLDNLVIPEGTEKISKYAFYNWSNITKISIPNTLKSIDDDAFAKNSISEVGIDNLESWLKIDFSTAKSVPMKSQGYFSIDGKLIDEIVIPKSVSEIKPYAFYNLSGLNYVVMGNNVKSIGESSFYHCNYINTVFFIGNEDEWHSIVIADGNSYLTDATKKFGCATLETANGELVLDENGVLLKYIGVDEHLTLPNTITSISEYAFSATMSLQELVIPNSVTYIGKSALSSCNNLQKLTIPYVGSEKDVTSNTHFGYIFGSDSYFYNYKNVPKTLKTVIISDAITIDTYAFYKCENIEKIHLPQTLSTIGASAFYYCNFADGVYVENLSSWYDINFKNATSNPLAYGNNLYSNGILVDNLVIPSDVEIIKQYAFAYCHSLKTIKIGTNVKEIQKGAFADCAYVEIVNFLGTKTEWEDIVKASDWDSSMGRYTSDTKYMLFTASVGIEYFLNADSVSYSAVVLGVSNDEQLIVPAQYENLPITQITILDNLKGKVILSSEKPKKVGFKFKGWSFAENGNVTYQAGDIYSSNDTTTLFAIWEAVPYTTLTITHRTNFDLIDIELFDLDIGCTVILAVYNKDNQLVNIQSNTYKGEMVSFVESNDYDTAKVMVWDSFTTLKPLCDVTEVKIENE